MDDKTSKGAPRASTGRDERRVRLAAELKANLARRKLQARGRRPEPEKTGGEDESSP